MKARLVFSEERRATLKQGLQHVKTGDGGWTTVYREAESGDMWLESQLYSEYHGGGWPYLARLPVPSADELVELAVNSTFLDEAEIAARLIADDPDARESLLLRLQHLANGPSPTPWLRISSVVNWASLEAGANRRPTQGKDMSQVRTDYEHFQNLARQASELRARAGEALRETAN